MHSKQEYNGTVRNNLNAPNVPSLKVTLHARHVLGVAKITMRLQKGTRCDDRDFCSYPVTRDRRTAIQLVSSTRLRHPFDITEFMYIF